MSKYKLIQLTNKNIGALAAQDFLPLGVITRRINSTCNNCATFQIGSSTSDIVYINEAGYYKITYTATLAAAAAGELTVSLLTNGTNVYSVSQTAPTGADDLVDLTLVYVIRVCPNCCGAPNNCPVAVQLQLGDVATVATSTANLIIEKIY